MYCLGHDPRGKRDGINDAWITFCFKSQSQVGYCTGGIVHITFFISVDPDCDLLVKYKNIITDLFNPFANK